MAAGIALIFNPDLFLMMDGQSEQTLIVAKMYGVLAFSFGAISFFIYKIFEFNESFKKMIMIFMAFHLMIALQMFAAYSQGNMPHLGAFGLHLILAALFFLGFMKEVKAFNPNLE